MQVLFDLQTEIEKIEAGDFGGSDFLMPDGDELPDLAVYIVDEVKTIHVKNRTDQTTGLGIFLSAIPNLRVGDRITVTGRVPRETPAGSWGVALVKEESDTRMAEECQLAQCTSPKSLFSLSHILCGEDLDSKLIVQTTRWGAINPIMDIFIDSILIFRDGKYDTVEEDPRHIVYSFDTDDNLQPGGLVSEVDIVTGAEHAVTYFLAKSGNPDINIFLHENSKAIYVGARGKDWDGVDINMCRLQLAAGNKYHVAVTGKIDGYAPEGTIITLQGMPGYSWRNNKDMMSNMEFSLEHTFTHAEVAQWTALRITTNSAGATVPFYIYSIEIKRLGLL